MSEPRFRIMGGPSVPWRLVEPYEDNARSNHYQSLARLNERGGLSPGELWCIVHGKRWREAPDEDTALRWLRTWLADDETATFAADRDRLAARLAEVEKERDEARFKLSNLADEYIATERSLRDARAKLAAVHANLDNVWLWQGDGGDSLPGLSCPVVMDAETLDAIVTERDAARAELAEFKAQTGALGDRLMRERDAARAECERLKKYVEHNDEEYKTMKDVLRAEHEACQRMRPVYEAAVAWRGYDREVQECAMAGVAAPMHLFRSRDESLTRIRAAVDAALSPTAADKGDANE